MAKKKSKAQKQKQSVKRKIKKQEKELVQKTTNVEVSQKKQSESKRALVEKDKVIYNVPVTKNTSVKKNKKNSKAQQKKLNTNANNKNQQSKQQANNIQTQKSKQQTNKKQAQKTTKSVYQINTIKKTSKSSKDQKNQPKQKKETIIKVQTPEKPIKHKNLFIRFFVTILKNLHIFFNAALIIVFAFLLIGLIRVEVFSKGTIAYICCITGFLSIIAISYNKYISGKIFTIIICALMSLGIYHLQYTYDFIRNLDEEKYEYKTYYVVALDNSSNTSIYSINNKKVGLLTENNINVKRILNTKLDKIEYIEYTDVNLLFNDFFEQKIRALIVSENQYKYLTNMEDSSNKEIRLLYDFKANAQK